MKPRSLLKSALSLSFFTFLSRILGLVREMTKAAFLGTSIYADAFGIAFMIPNLFRRLFAENSISVAFIPTFRAYLEDSSEEGVKTTKEFVKATLTLVSFLTAVVVTIGVMLAPFIVKIFYNGDSDNAELVLKETAILTRIMFPYLFVISIAAFFQGVLNGVKIFSPSGFTPVLFNSIVIAFTYIFSSKMENPARAMAVGVIVGGTIQALFQLPFVVKTGWFCGFSSIKKAFTNPGTRRVLALVGPTIIGMAAYQINDVVSTALAGKAGTGIVSSLQYSLRLQELILGIFAVTIGTVILPDLSGLAKSKNWEKFNEMLTQAVKIMILISVPITFYSLVTGEEIISLVYKGKKFDEESVALTLSAFRFHIIGLVFIAVNRVVSPAFYAQGNTKSPTLAGILGFIVNMALALAFVKPFSGGGIALALTIASLANTFFLFLFLKKSPDVDVKTVIKGVVWYTIKILLLSIVASVPTYFLHGFLCEKFSEAGRLIGNGIPLALSGIAFGAIGVVGLFVTKDEILSLVRKNKNTIKNS